MGRAVQSGRTKILGGLWDYLKENKDYPYYLIRDRFAGTGGRSLRAITRGTGEVIEVDGQPAAVYRGLDSEIHVRVGRLHAHGLLRPLERRRAHVGLPVPRLAIQDERRSDRGAGGNSRCADEVTAKSRRTSKTRATESRVATKRISLCRQTPVFDPDCDRL